MGRKCCVPNCNSGYKSCAEKVAFFSVPKDVDLANKWRRAIPRKDKILTHSDSVCEKHFDPEEIQRTWSNGKKIVSTVFNIPFVHTYIFVLK